MANDQGYAAPRRRARALMRMYLSWARAPDDGCPDGDSISPS